MGSMQVVQSEPAVSAEQARWYAVHTRPRHEKKIVAELERKGVSAFLPLVREVRRWSDRRTTVEFPLFSCYVFVNLLPAPESRVSVLRSYGVLSLVGNGWEGTPIPDQQIEDIKRLVRGKVPFTCYPFLAIGQKVRIRGGALDGIEGILTRRNGNDRLVISVETIQRSFSISVEGYEVEPVGSVIHRA